MTAKAIAFLAFVALAAAAPAGTPEGKAAWAAGDYARAIAQYRPAAEAGDADAQFGMGEAYRLGRGVTADQDMAMSWYRRSASLGNTQARDALGLTLFASGHRAEAMPLLEKAAAGGDARALYILGTAHFNGDNTTRDWALGYAMMSRAAASGLPQAKTSLDVMDRYLFPADKVKAQQLLAGMTAPVTASPDGITATPKSAPKPTIVRADPRPTPPSVARSTEDVIVSRPDPGRIVQAPPPAPIKPVAIAKADATKPAPVAKADPVKAAPAPAKAGAWKVQLGAFGSAERVETAWTKLSGKVLALKRLDHRMVEAGPVKRLQALGIADRAAANDLCKAVVAAGGDCLAMAPERP